MCEFTGNRVRHFASDGTAIATTSLSGPARVAVDSVNHVAWVSSPDRGLVTLLGADGRHLDSLSVARTPLGVTIDCDHDRVWIADVNSNRVIVVTLSTRATERVITGLTAPRDIAIDRVSGEAWVVASGDRAIDRLSATGVELERVGGLTSPAEVRFDRGN